MRKALAIAAVLIWSCTAAAAQETTTGSIDGRIVDPQGLPVPGVTVTVSSAQGAQSFVTDSDGRFLAPFLTPGAYIIRAELAGFRPLEQPNVQVRLGQRVTLPLTLPLGELTEQVEVRAEVPVLNTSSASVGANIDSELLTRIPIGRRFSDTLYMAPGVSSGGTVGQANPSISGGSGLENQYVVDEVNITKPGSEPRVVLDRAWIAENRRHLRLHPGSPGDDRRLRSPVGQATGGVVNVVTKTGRTDSAERRSATSSPPLPRALSNRCRRLRRHASKP